MARFLRNLLSFAVIGLAAIPVSAAEKTAAEKKAPVVPDSLEFITDIEYGEAAGEKLLLDLAVPKVRPKPLPAIVFIHGGAWVSGSRRDFRIPMLGVSNLGYVCVTVDYRLGPKHPFPAQIEDVKCAVRWLRANAKKYNIDTEHIAAVGGSAGGHLAAMLGTTCGDKKWEGTGGHADQSSRIHAMVCHGAPADFTLALKHAKDFHGLLKQMLGGTIEQVPERYREMSPVTYAKKETVPTLLIHGTNDKIVPLEQAEVFEQALKKAGAQVELVRMEGAGHSDFGKQPHLVVARLVEFLQKELKETPR